jgi:hypothetical protein
MFAERTSKIVLGIDALALALLGASALSVSAAWVALLLALAGSLVGAEVPELWLAARSFGAVFVCCASAAAVVLVSCEAVARR